MNIKTRNYTSMKEYDDALSRGCKNGGVDVIFDEIPYVKLFLHKYGSKYQTISSKMDGTATGGFGFVSLLISIIHYYVMFMIQYFNKTLMQ